MPFTDVARRRRQSGQSLVEPLVASALLGIGVVAGLTAVDAGTLGANQALGQQRAQCVVRVEAEYISSAAWRVPKIENYDTSIAPGLAVGNNWAQDGHGSPVGGLAKVTITYTEPKSHATYSTTLLKSKALSGTPVAPPSAPGCPT